MVDTDEPEERLQAVVEETEARCPVLNLIREARENQLPAAPAYIKSRSSRLTAWRESATTM